jgi:hypothetical protein
MVVEQRLKERKESLIWTAVISTGLAIFLIWYCFLDPLYKGDIREPDGPLDLFFMLVGIVVVFGVAFIIVAAGIGDSKKEMKSIKEESDRIRRTHKEVVCEDANATHEVGSRYKPELNPHQVIKGLYEASKSAFEDAKARYELVKVAYEEAQNIYAKEKACYEMVKGVYGKEPALCEPSKGLYERAKARYAEMTPPYEDAKIRYEATQNIYEKAKAVHEEMKADAATS